MKILENQKVSSNEINALMKLCWETHQNADYESILKHSLSYFTVRNNDGTLIAFCNLAWDGGRHATIFDLVVHPNYRNQGLALNIIQLAKQNAQKNKINYFHVDFDQELEALYKKAGFEMISAGLIIL